MLQPARRPRSFVIVGGSVSGLALAGALSRRPENRVVVLSSPPEDGRRLVAGCSLRASALHHLAAALGVTVPALVGRLTGGDGVFSRLTLRIGRAARDGALRYGPTVVLHDTGSPVRPLGLSTRHAQILHGLRALLGERGVPIVPTTVTDREQAAAHALEAPATLIDATPGGVLVGRMTDDGARDHVVAVQAPCVLASDGLRDPLAPGSAHAEIVRIGARSYACFFTPFGDRRSPRAGWYAFIGTIVDRAHAADRAGAIASAGAHLERLVANLGLALHDPHETLGSAVLPVPPARPVLRDGVLDAYHGFESGAPGIAADGMYAMAVAARACADALDSDESPERRVARALRRIRRDNRLTQRLLTHVPVGLPALVARLAPHMLVRQYVPGWVAPAEPSAAGA